MSGKEENLHLGEWWGEWPGSAVNSFSSAFPAMYYVTRRPDRICSVSDRLNYITWAEWDSTPPPDVRMVAVARGALYLPFCYGRRGRRNDVKLKDWDFEAFRGEPLKGGILLTDKEFDKLLAMAGMTPESYARLARLAWAEHCASKEAKAVLPDEA